MNNLKIRSKISLGFLCLFVLLLLISIISISFTTATGSNIADMDKYGTLQNYANDLMFILNETRITAGVFYATHSAESYADLEKQFLYCDKRLQKLDAYISSTQGLDGFKTGIGEFSKLYAQWRGMIDTIRAGYPIGEAFSKEQDEAFAEYASDTRSVNLRAYEALSRAGDEIEDTTAKVTRATRKSGAAATIFVISISAAALIAALIIAVILIRSITRPIGYMRDVMTQIGKYGDLKIEKGVLRKLRKVAAGKDETAQCTVELLALVERLNEIDGALFHVSNGDLTASPSLRSERDTIGLAVVKMLENLNREFGTITVSAEQVNRSATELSSDSQLLASGSNEQTASVGNLSDSVTRVSRNVEKNTELSKKAADLTGNIRVSAKVGTEKMNQMIQATTDINDASQDIIKVIKVIDDIAFQTNILALNAAVEAARAGQHGKGFAVVADEVRNLAAKSAVAAKETGQLIEGSTQKASLGAAIAEETSKYLQEIVSGVEDSDAIMRDIYSLSREQSADISQIITDVNQVGQIAKQNGAISSRSASAASGISEQSGVLRELVGHFKLADAAEANYAADYSSNYKEDTGYELA